MDAFLLALSHLGSFLTPEVLDYMIERGYGVDHFKRTRALLVRHGYLIRGARGIYTVNPELYYLDPAGRIRVNPPEMAREPRLDLLLIVLSGDATPGEAFMRLYASARDPRALYMRARRELLRYGYIEDKYGNRFYYPGPRMRFLFNILF
ncbi:MAG: hypothetical protein ACP5QE_07805 [Conexivisphaera sp.]